MKRFISCICVTLITVFLLTGCVPSSVVVTTDQGTLNAEPRVTWEPE